MACLGSVLYDPASIATGTLSALKAMTAMDTTNARITFTAPANGKVLVKIRVATKGATISGAYLLGVLDGSTVRGRQSPFIAPRSGSANTAKGVEAVFLVTGLTPGNNYTFDAAYGVETLLASTLIGWGGPNDTTSANAYGALSFEVWETENLLAGVHYDPGTAVSKDTATLAAMTAMDTTNLRLNFTPPASGRVLVRLRGTLHGATTIPGIFLGVLEGSTIKMRAAPFHNSLNAATGNATDLHACEACAVISGLTPGTPVNWDAAWSVDTVVASSGLKYGGPNDATANNAFGGFTFEVWKA